MKNTLVYDKNNHPIFEGDTIIFPTLDVILEEGFYEYANIDKVVGKVRKIGNVVGTIIDIKFFSGDKQVETNEQIKNYLVEVKGKKEEDVLKHYQEKGLSLSEYSTRTLDSNKYSDVFIKNFVHVDTLIIESEYSLEEKKKHKNEPLKITLGEIEAMENDSRFLLKEPVDHFFIGFYTNIERLKEFHEHGCKIEVFKS